MTMNSILNVAAVSTLATLSIYHVMIYLGRRKYKDEIYNLIFSFFSFTIALTITLSAIQTTNRIFIKSKPLLESIIISCLVISCIFLIGNIISFSGKNTKLLLKICIPLLIIQMITASTKIYLPEEIFDNVISKFGPPFGLASGLIPLSIHILWIVKKKLFKVRRIKILVTGIFTAAFIPAAILPVNYYLTITVQTNNLYCILVGIALLFAYVLADKFNNEHKDLVELKNDLEKKITERTVQLEEAVMQKTNFLINITHEIKTPITLISNYLDKYIRISKPSEEIHIVKRNVDKLEKDIINFMDMEKLNQGRLLYNHSRFLNISEFTEASMKLFEEYAWTKKIVIDHHIEDGIFIKIDSSAYERILNNILENAIKYTEEKGKIELKLFVDKNKPVLQIKDTGIGIPEDRQKYIFDPYYQISREKKNIQGMGVGLFIIKKIIENIDGKINLHSIPGHGTVFTITFSKTKKTLDKNEIAEKKVTQHSILPKQKIVLKEELYKNDRKNIFIVEDNIDMLAYLQDSMYDLYNVFYAENGFVASNKLNIIPKPDIIISDIMMDEMDGYDFLKTIRGNPKLKHIPFIFLTAKSSKEEKLKGLAYGAIDFIPKPFQTGELIAKINSIIDNIGLYKKAYTEEISSKILENNDRRYAMNAMPDKIDLIFDKYNIIDNDKIIINYLLKGFEYKTISDKMQIKLNTLKRRINIIYKKLNVKNKIELINFINNISI